MKIKYERNNNTWLRFQIFKFLGFMSYANPSSKYLNCVYLSYGRGDSLLRSFKV